MSKNVKSFDEKTKLREVRFGEMSSQKIGFLYLYLTRMTYILEQWFSTRVPWHLENKLL